MDSGWVGWFCTIFKPTDADGDKITDLMLELLSDNINFDRVVGSYNCKWFSLTFTNFVFF